MKWNWLTAFGVGHFETHFNNSSSRGRWQGVKILTVYSSSSSATITSTLPDTLDQFSACFSRNPDTSPAPPVENDLLQPHQQPHQVRVIQHRINASKASWGGWSRTAQTYQRYLQTSLTSRYNNQLSLSPCSRRIQWTTSATITLLAYQAKG